MNDERRAELSHAGKAARMVWLIVCAGPRGITIQEIAHDLGVPPSYVVRSLMPSIECADVPLLVEEQVLRGAARRFVLRLQIESPGQ